MPFIYISSYSHLCQRFIKGNWKLFVTKFYKFVFLIRVIMSLERKMQNNGCRLKKEKIKLIYYIMSIIFPEFSIGLFKIRFKLLHVIISVAENWKVYRCARKRSNFWHGFGFDEIPVILWYNSLEFQIWRHVKMVIFLTERWKKTNQLSV